MIYRSLSRRNNSKSNNYCLIDGTRIQKGKDGTTSFCQRKKESVRARESEIEREIRRQRTSFPTSFPHLHHLREENSSLARSRKRKEGKEDELCGKEGKKKAVEEAAFTSSWWRG